MRIEDLAWLLSALSIFASYLNIKKRKICFVLFTLTNIGFIWLNIKGKLYGQIPMWIVYTGMNVWGYIAWGGRIPLPRWFCKFGVHDWIRFEGRKNGKVWVTKECSFCSRVKGVKKS